MENKQNIEIKGVIELIRKSVRVNGEKVTMSLSTWRLIEEIVSRVKLEVSK